MADPEKSKIKITAPKIPILFMSDFCDTGFGIVGKELTARLAEMEIFDVHYLGWFAKEEDKEFAAKEGVTLHLTEDKGGDHFGTRSFAKVVQKIQPKAVITLGDPWMVAHVQAAPNREEFMWISYTPIDRDFISRTWRRIMRKPDILVLYSQFGMDVVNEQIPFTNPVLILHGVDRMTFKPWYPANTDENTPTDELMRERKRTTMGDKFKDKFIVGFVGRNQIRKAIPRAFRAFKAFNCETWCTNGRIEVSEGDDKDGFHEYRAEEFCNNVQKFRCDVCPAFQQRAETADSIIFLHTTAGDGKDPQDKPGIGWLIPELGERYGLAGRVGMTPNITSTKGIPRAGLAQLMNCFDIHLFMSHSEGFGLPIVETLACGVPTFVTDYSSMPELISDGGGRLIDVIDYNTYVTWENDWASADIGDAATKMNELFEDKELYTQMRKDAAANRYTPTWDEVAMKFRELILKAIV